MNSVSRSVRFGIVGHGTAFPEWQARCIDGLLSCPEVRPVLLLIDPTQAGIGPQVPALLWARSLLSRSSAGQLVDFGARLQGVPSLPCREPDPRGAPSGFAPETLRRIREEKVDFLLHLGTMTVTGEALRAPAHGIWAFRFGGGKDAPGEPPGFWEVYRGDFATRAALVRLGDGADEGTVLVEGYFRTSLESYPRTADAVLLGVAGWPAAACRDLLAGRAGSQRSGQASASLAPVRPPTNAESTRLLGMEFIRTAGALYRGLVRHDDWTIGVVDAPIHAFLEKDFRPDIDWIPPPGDSRFIADPFGLEVDGGLHIIYEDFDYRTARGTIAAIPADRPVPRTPPRVAIELGVPSSYPYLFRHDGQVYCIPETRISREATLHRLISFPDRWEKVGPLVRGVAAVDSTVFEHHGRWWLLCTDQDQGENLRLFVWHAPRLEGPWEPHASNPVRTDVRSSRPAGTPFVVAGHLYRPAQDCSRTYGGRVVVNRVVRLTPTEFEEETVASVGPFSGTPFPEGVHTLSAVGERTVLDGKRYRFMPRAVPYVVRRGIAGARP